MSDFFDEGKFKVQRCLYTIKTTHGQLVRDKWIQMGLEGIEPDQATLFKQECLKWAEENQKPITVEMGTVYSYNSCSTPVMYTVNHLDSHNLTNKYLQSSQIHGIIPHGYHTTQLKLYDTDGISDLKALEWPPVISINPLFNDTQIMSIENTWKNLPTLYGSEEPIVICICLGMLVAPLAPQG